MVSPAMSHLTVPHLVSVPHQHLQPDMAAATGQRYSQEVSVHVNRFEMAFVAGKVQVYNFEFNFVVDSLCCGEDARDGVEVRMP